MASPQLTLLYDGACPICAWEKRKLKRYDKQARLTFIDISAPDFDPNKYGVTQDALMGSLHAFTAEGRLIKGVDTLIASYRAVNWWWAYLPLICAPRSITASAYAWFADHRCALSKRFGGLFGPVCDTHCSKPPAQS